MKHNLITAAAWVNTDPRRARVVTLSFAVGMMVLAVLVPGSIAFAGWASGGSD